MKNSANSQASHFIAINYHGYHSSKAALDCVRSVLLSAKELSGQVDITFFHHSHDPVAAALAIGLENLRVDRMDFPDNSNGENLNRQIEQAKGFSYFYRVDADDLVSPERFKWQEEHLSKSGCDICGGGLMYRSKETCNEYQVLPPASPGTISYLFNRYFLHPTLAFRLETFKIRYGQNRMEDKELALFSFMSGLTIVNDQRIYGTYNLNPNARSGKTFARRDFGLNLAYIRAARSYWALPLAYSLLVLSLLIHRDKLRIIRKILLAKGRRIPVASSGSACENAKAEKTLPPSK